MVREFVSACRMIVDVLLLLIVPLSEYSNNVNVQCDLCDIWLCVRKFRLAGGRKITASERVVCLRKKTCFQ